jgi:hypothetical protein
VQPARIEVLGGDAVVAILQTDTAGSVNSYNTTFFRVQRGSNAAVELFSIPNYVLDFVCDGVSKILAVDIAGNMWLIDTGLSSSTPNPGYLGFNAGDVGLVIGSIPLPSVYVPPRPLTSPVGNPGDIISLATGSISLEFGNGSLVATATYNGASTTVHVFSVPTPPIATTTELALLSTHTVNERLGGIAFDGGKYFYGRSIDTAKFFRFDSGLEV